MIKFHYATLDDKAHIDELLHNSNERGCEYSFTPGAPPISSRWPQ